MLCLLMGMPGTRYDCHAMYEEVLLARARFLTALLVYYSTSYVTINININTTY